MIGARLTFFQLFRLTILRYFNGPTFMGNPSRRIFNYEIGIGIVPRNFVEMVYPMKINIHYCNSCGPFVRGYSEVWKKGDSDPFEIQFFQYEKGIRHIIDKIQLKPSQKHTSSIMVDYCGECNDIIKKEKVSVSAFKSGNNKFIKGKS